MSEDNSGGSETIKKVELMHRGAVAVELAKSWRNGKFEDLQDWEYQGLEEEKPTQQCVDMGCSRLEMSLENKFMIPNDKRRRLAQQENDIDLQVKPDIYEKRLTHVLVCTERTPIKRLLVIPIIIY